jgi:carbamoyl-phosphate synthase large subunit
MSKTVLVTGIGGNVAQGILRNILSYDYKIRLIGTNVTTVSGGNHLCDAVYKAPFSSKPEYVPTIKKICKKEKVDIIIPATDYETYYLALAKDELPTLASSGPDVAFIFLNKYKTWQEFKKAHIPFAETRLPSKYSNEFDEITVKPIEGRGSRDLHINPANPKSFSDEYIIQKLYKGTEVTTAFYVTKKRRLLGYVAFKRTLSHGATDLCEVTFEYNNKLEKIIKKMIGNFDIKGSCNIQSIVQKNGTIIPFEINGRISGTNSIRAQFGFEDVRYTLEEYLYKRSPEKPVIKKGSAVRILMDVIYPGISLKQIRNKNTKHDIF